MKKGRKVQKNIIVIKIRYLIKLKYNEKHFNESDSVYIQSMKAASMNPTDIIVSLIKYLFL